METWQKELLTKIDTHYKSGKELKIMMTGRRTGKSAYARLWNDIITQRPLEDVLLSEGRVFGARYHTAEPIGGNWADMEAWARKTYGEPAEIWEAHNFIWPDCGRWYMNDRKFWFRNERDRTLFVLRWSR
jgi:hypothetical protein